MSIEDLLCPCGAGVSPVHHDDGVVLQCADGCSLVVAQPAPSVLLAVDAWLAALPHPPLEDALEAFVYNSAGALMQAQTPQELVQLAPLAETLISYLQLLSTRPAGDEVT